MMLGISLIVFLLGFLSLNSDIENSSEEYSILTTLLFVIAIALFFFGGGEEVKV